MIVTNIAKQDTRVEAPPAKAYTLRAILLGALAQGTSIVHKPLLGEDQIHLIDCLKTLGVEITQTDKTLTIQGNKGVFTPLSTEINVGESGVAMNTLAAVTSLIDKTITITGADSLLERPVGDLVDGLRQLGCTIEYSKKEGFPPIVVTSSSISGGTAQLSGKKTSQYFSSMALSAPLAKSDVTIICTDDMSEKPYFDITVDMMNKFGVTLTNDNYMKIQIQSGQKYMATEYTVEGDYSSASFFMLAAAICKSKITINGLNKESKQGDRAFIDYLSRMGCLLRWENNDDDLVVTGTELQPITVNMSDTPDLVPPLAIAAAFANGKSTFTNVGHLRYKECNRLEAMKTELAKLGINSSYDQDFIIEGNPTLLRSIPHKGASIDCWNDHRIAMSFAICGLTVPNIDITNPACVGKSFPDFWQRLKVFY